MNWKHGLLSTVFLIGVWQLVIIMTGIQRFILPPPWTVLETLWTSRALIAEHTLVTLTEIIIGMIIGTILGVATALNLAVSTTARAILRPILVFLQAMPVFALAPILVLWFGFGIAPKIIMAVMIIYFPITSAFFDGLMKTPTGYMDLAKTMGAKSINTLWHIRFKAALPSLGSGLRLAAVYAPIGAVIGEWVGGSKGLGYLMLLANGRVKTDLLFASLFVLAFVTVCLHLAVDILARRLEKDH
ncbi:ABC transporter permease [Amylibacter sp. SFDW26]|uniref:ABC transporter permease n=1 Tax=Amylibacter sp. SFDW26 TaxID=2652722 RepID=UPI0012614485|nr:ABC transporter permease [Amylibacter sp. SFDW26]KAB7613802.1 ABC transporter permease [Amylibacter sp. SFDW26]